MRLVSETHVQALVSALPADARVVCSGNFATPHHLLGLIDKTLESYRLYILNAQVGIPERPGVVPETSFIGPGMRRSALLSYVPSRLSLVPLLFRSSLAPDLVVVHTSTPYEGTVSLGMEVNVLPAAIEAIRRRGGLVVAQINPRMPFTYGDGVIATDQIDVAIEVDEPLPSPAAVPIDEASRQIGALVAAR
ncbi:MAG: 4-hydroxybutyrate CoA-transferase, partial [Jiangellaceae bacterium]